MGRRQVRRAVRQARVKRLINSPSHAHTLRSVGRDARKVATTTAAADVATVAGDDVTSSNDQFTTPLAFHALVSAVVDLTLGIGVTEDAGEVWIINHQISIAPDGNLALAGIQAEDLGGLRAADIDHGLEIDTPSTHAMRMHEVYAFLYAGNPVGNEREGLVDPYPFDQ